MRYFSTDGRTNQRTNEQGDSRSRICDLDACIYDAGFFCYQRTNQRMNQPTDKAILGVGYTYDVCMHDIGVHHAHLYHVCMFCVCMMDVYMYAWWTNQPTNDAMHALFVDMCIADIRIMDMHIIDSCFIYTCIIDKHGALVCMMPISMIYDPWSWYMCVWCAHLCVRCTRVCTMCTYDVRMVCMVHISMILVFDLGTCMYDARI